MSYKFNPFTGNFDLDPSGSNSAPVFDINSVGSGTTNAVINNTYLVDTSGGAATIQLPTPVLDGYVTVKDKGSANTNNITVARAGSEDIEGVATDYVVDSDFASLIFVSDGTDWFIL